jgi:hypothetical protein
MRSANPTGAYHRNVGMASTPPTAETERLLAVAERLRADHTALGQQNGDDVATPTAAIQRFHAANVSRPAAMTSVSAGIVRTRREAVIRAPPPAVPEGIVERRPSMAGNGTTRPPRWYEFNNSWCHRIATMYATERS